MVERFAEETLPEDVQAAVRSFAEGERQAMHPSAEELVAYHAGELSDPASEGLREHLALCSECTRILLDLAGFEDLAPPTEADRLSDDDEAILKRSIEERMQEEGLGTTPTEVASARKARYAVPPIYWGAVAALLLLAVGLGLRDTRQVPGGTPELFHLYPQTFRSTEQAIFRVPTWADSYVLILGSVGSDSHQIVRMELRDAEGRVVLGVESLPRSGDGTFHHSLPWDRLPEGVYRIHLFGLDSEPPEPLESYTFEIIFDAPR